MNSMILCEAKVDSEARGKLMNINKTILLEAYMFFSLILCSNYQTLYELTDSKLYIILSFVWAVMVLISGFMMIRGIYKDGCD